MNPPRQKNHHHGRELRGFALIITITLMVLLSLLSVGLLGLSSAALRGSSRISALSEARANARLALNLALGELQLTMGPDQRISGRAATLAQHPQVGASPPTASPRAWWVGAAHSDPGEAAAVGGRPVTWLVSGLDPDAPPGAQLSAPFDAPVVMFGKHSVDLERFTGGQPIKAGNVSVGGARGDRTGGYAYFIDDHGMKAQLATANPEVSNDRNPPRGGGVLPGSYDLSILTGMESLDGTAVAEYHKLWSLNDLRLIGGDQSIAREKRLGYTTVSRGVLSDVRKGGLKRDLTIAFERAEVFEVAFPNEPQVNRFDGRFVVMDPGKFAASPDLQANGYIHWGMLRDYYNTKRFIQGGTGSTPEYLDPLLFHKAGIFNNASDRFGRGQLGPHEIGANSDVPTRHHAMPYRDYLVIPNKTVGDFRHSPVIPILQRLQMNAWVERLGPAEPGRGDRLRTRVQLWASHYNPYNISLRALGNLDNSTTGLRLITFPQVRFTIPDVNYQRRDNQGQPIGEPLPFSNIEGLHNKRQSHVNHEIMLQPGRSHVLAFRRDAGRGGEIDSQLYGQEVRNLTLESVFQDYEVAGQLPEELQLEVDFYLPIPSMSHGMDMNPGDYEVSQTFWAPFAWDSIADRWPGKSFSHSTSPGELNENTMAAFTFHLRSTREGPGSIRPLVDVNVRALLSNPKWDSPLGLPILAAYSPENAGEAHDQFFPMDTRDNPKGYSFWGAGSGPSYGFDRVILFDIPRQDLVSLGQLQHAMVGRFSYEPTYIVGNSYANPRIPLTDWRGTVTDTFSTAERGLSEFAIPGRFNLYDASYLVNEELWDSYIFTTIPQIADNHSGLSEPTPNDSHFEALIAGDALLPNPRFLPYEPPGSRFDRETLQMPGRIQSIEGGFHHNAGHLLVDGSFNVNSTSVDAWEAFLSGTHRLPYQQLTGNGSVSGFSQSQEGNGVRFPRVKSVFGGPMEKDRLDENYWIGFRTLKPGEVRELAEAIVEEITARGPFLTLGEFVNRKLESGAHGQRGALQAALDRTVNKDLDRAFENPTGRPDIPSDSTQGAGFPGQLLQGDVLQALSPYMTVRSDTFTIRAYGESRAAGSGEVQARAWCEVTVQRFPDPVADASANPNPLVELVQPSSIYGRAFRIISFRWLSPEEL